MGVRVKDPSTGQFKEIYVKALDSLPVGTIVDYDGQTSDIPTGWETYGTGQIKKTSETRPLASHTVNAYSESESNAYSCDYINGALDYSTEEVNTHKKWIDGKDIYRKVVIGTPASTYSHSISNIDTITKFEFYIVRSNGGLIPNGYWYDSTNYVTAEMLNKNIINMYGPYITSQYTFRATLEYTKTTDTSQSTRSSNTYSGDIEEKKDIVIDDGEEEKPIDEGNDENNK